MSRDKLDFEIEASQEREAKEITRILGEPEELLQAIWDAKPDVQRRLLEKIGELVIFQYRWDACQSKHLAQLAELVGISKDIVTDIKEIVRDWISKP